MHGSHGELHSALLETDWNAEWMRLQESRRKADDSSVWDTRAKHFRPKETAPYARDFIRLLALEPRESVLDMGCGGGSIALPLAQDAHPVIAADFSDMMIAALKEGIEHYALHDRVQPLKLAWDDDWKAAGIADKCVDVSFASRSIATHDLKAALVKLDRTARRRCCITLVSTAGPHQDMHIMNAIGASVTSTRDFIYAFNILTQMGALPRVDYIDSPRRDTFNSLEDGVTDFARMLEGGNEDKLARLRAYIAEHMVENPDVGKPGSKGVPQGRYMLDHIRIIHWAFISWTPCLELS